MLLVVRESQHPVILLPLGNVWEEDGALLCLTLAHFNPQEGQKGGQSVETSESPPYLSTSAGPTW